MFIMIDKHDYAVCIWDPVYRLQLYRVGWGWVDVGGREGVDCVRRKMFAHEFFSLYLSCQRKHFVAPGFGIVVWLVYLWSNLQLGTWWHAGYWLGCCSGSFRARVRTLPSRLAFPCPPLGSKDEAMPVPEARGKKDGCTGLEPTRVVSIHCS